MDKYSSKLVIAAGFTAMLLLLLLLMGVWVITIAGNNERLHSVVNQQKVTELVLTMRDAAHKRALVLHRMLLLEDPFELDEQNMLLSEQAAEFIRARDTLLAMDLKGDQQEVWRAIRSDVTANSRAQDEVAELVLAGRIEDANRRLAEQVIPIQNSILGELTKLLNRSRVTVQEELSGFGSYNGTAYLFVSALGMATLLLGTGTAVFVIRKTVRTEEALVQAKTAEADANQLKSQFLANMSHEIRTPLTAVIGFAEASLDGELSAAERDEATRTIINNSRHLLHVINEILDLSKIESNHLKVERIKTPLTPVLADVESVMGMQARAKGLTFSIEYEYPLPQCIVTDPTRLKQILLNLCSNAIKFTEKGGVRLIVECTPAEQALCLSVLDTGIGMSAEQQARMFMPFSQADASMTRRFGGTGLGLYISKQLAEMLGGSIRLQSVPGVGTRIEVTVDTGPIDSSNMSSGAAVGGQGKEQAPSTPQGPGKLGGTVLLAEDSVDNQRLVSLYIKRTGAQVELASDGKEAVEKALAGDYHLLLMDMQMPVMDGVEATEWLRKAGYGGPIVALTANAMKEDRERYARAGCDGFLSKPIETAAFQQVLARYLPSASESEAHDKAGSRFDIDPDLYRLATEFVAGLPARMQGMRSANERADWKELASLAHQLKGIAGSFGFGRITEQAALIERGVKVDEHAALNGLLVELEALCQQAMATLERHDTTEPKPVSAGTGTFEAP